MYRTHNFTGIWIYIIFNRSVDIYSTNINNIRVELNQKYGINFYKTYRCLNISIFLLESQNLHSAWLTLFEKYDFVCKAQANFPGWYLPPSSWINVVNNNIRHRQIIICVVYYCYIITINFFFFTNNILFCFNESFIKSLRGIKPKRITNLLDYIQNP